MTPFSFFRYATLVLLAAACFACGSDQAERGIETEPEVAVPLDRADMAETDEQRQADLADEME